MQIIYWIVFGLVVGIIARFLMPGPQPMGMILTAALGIVGSFVGGALANLIHGANPFDLRATSWIGSIIGAFLLLLIFGIVSKRNTGA